MSPKSPSQVQRGPGGPERGVEHPALRALRAGRGRRAGQVPPAPARVGLLIGRNGLEMGLGRDGGGGEMYIHNGMERKRRRRRIKGGREGENKRERTLEALVGVT